MKRILNNGEYVFTPSTNQIQFLVSLFRPQQLYAVINTTTGKLVYSSSGQTSGFGGSFSTTTNPDDTLTYTSSNAGQNVTDLLQCIYEDQITPQLVSGSITTSGSTNINDGSGNPIGSASDPLTGDYKLWTDSFLKGADGTPVLTTYDPQSGEDGLNVNILNSSFGGQIGSAIPIPNNNSALSVGFLNSATSTLVTPRMDPVTNELIVQSSPAPMQNVNIAEVNGAAISGSKVPVTVDGFGGSSVSLGQNLMVNSIPVTVSSNQSAIPITATTPINVNVKQSVSQDVLGVAVGGNRNNQIEVAFNSAPGASLITNTFTGAGSVNITQGHSIYQTGTVNAAASAQAVSVQTTTYRPAHEVYAAFTAAFLNMVSGRSDAKIGIFDTSNGFFLGYDITQGFSVGLRSAGIDTIIPRASWNTDLLDGNASSKFTRNGTPEAILFGNSNLFRIRFAWLGSANIYFEVFSPDGEWVMFHNIRQPNSSFLPSVENPNLPMTVRVSKTTGVQNSQIATSCWGGGTTSAYSPISETITNRTLAAMTRSVITGESSVGGGSFVNCKVTPSGAMVTATTVDSSVLPTGAATSALQTTGNTSLSSIDTKLTNNTQTTRITDGTNTAAVKAASTAPLATDPSLVVTVSPNSPSLPTTTNINQYGGAATSLGQKASSASIPVVISSDQSTLNTFAPDQTITGALTGTVDHNILLSTAGTGALDVSGYKSLTVQVVSTASTGNLFFECSNVGGTGTTNWQAQPVFRIDSASPNAIVNAISITATTLIYHIPIKTRFIRARITIAPSSGTLQGISRLSQESWSPIIPNVINATGSNLNAVISGSLSSAGTVTASIAASQTLATVTTVSTITAANSASTIVTDLNAQSVITTGTSGNIATANQQSHSFGIAFVYTTGTGSIDLTIQESYDNGSSWVDVYTLDRVNSAGTFRQNIPAMKIGGNLIRYSWVITGSVTTATLTVQRTNRAGIAPLLRRIYDRTLVPATLASSTPAVFTEGCEYSDLIVNMAAGGTAPVIQLQGSEDSSNWYNIGSGLTATVGAVSALNIAEGTLPRFLRATVATAGTGSTLGYIALKAKGAS